MAGRAQVLVSAAGRARVERALEAMAGWPADRAVWVVGDRLLAARELVHWSSVRGARLGWLGTTLDVLAWRLAARELAAGARAPVSGAALVAIAERVVARLGVEGGLGRFAAAAGRPGLAVSLAATWQELRLAGVDGDAIDRVDGDLGRVTAALERELEEIGLADRAAVLGAAAAAVRSGRHSVSGGERVVFLDVAVRHPAEEALVAAIAGGAREVVATVVAGDDRSARAMERALGVKASAIEAGSPGSVLEQAQRRLFGEDDAPVRDADDSLTVFSAPGESRECVEIARRILELARDGICFDRIAVLLRAPHAYRVHLTEALERAGIPAHFSRGTRRPDPAGRALLALLACAEEGLSARAFAEYLSLSVVPEPTPDGAPPPAPAAGERFVPADPFASRVDVVEAEDEPSAGEQARAPDGSLRAPRRWERLLVDAAVVGGLDRWRRRLDGLAKELERRAAGLDDPDDPRAAWLERDRLALANLRGFALPLLELLAALPARAAWGAWLERLSELAVRAIRRPGRILEVLAELEPLAPVGPVGLEEVRAVLAARLRELVERPRSERFGRVFVGAIDEARGLSFEVVFVPGLAERLFPPKLTEDPMLLDRRRVLLSPDLPTADDRVQGERLALRLALGAAARGAILSYPRLDSAEARPRVPSFYALEVLRAGEGTLPGFGALAERARDESQARMNWPAPEDPARAIDETEYDLGVLEQLLRAGTAARGAARYLLDTNEHLARALRFRARRWGPIRFTPADGLVVGEDEPAPAREHLARHRLDRRPYSATALQSMAACPYRFYLRALVRLEAQEAPGPIEDLDPLQRGSFFHEAQRRILVELGATSRLPLAPGALDGALADLDQFVDQLAAEAREELFPAIDRVFSDSIAAIRTDLRQWLRALVGNPWLPTHFELAFGLDLCDRDPASRPEPVKIPGGITLRGSIDLVEQKAGRLRATDHKTGKNTTRGGLVIGAGEILQPVLYALALEVLFPDATVEGGRLSFCTERGGFTDAPVPLDHAAREAAEVLARTVDQAVETGFFPAAPRLGACDFCDYRIVCGPYEERRTARKDRRALEALERLRGQP